MTNWNPDPSPQANVTYVHHNHITQLRAKLEEAHNALHLSIGSYAHAGPNAGDKLTFTHFKYGAAINFRNSSNELEFFGWDGTQYRAVLTVIRPTGGGNEVQFRNTTDTNSVRMVYNTNGDPFLSTEKPGTNFALSPQGNLILSPTSNVVEQRGAGPGPEFRLYGTYLSDTNYDRVSLKYDTTNSQYVFGTAVGTTVGLLTTNLLGRHVSDRTYDIALLCKP